MPFCPKCKYEYKEGIKVCSDCGALLVETLDMVSVSILTRDENTVNEAIDFLAKNGFTGAFIAESDTVDSMYDLMVPEAKSKEAVGMLNVYYREIHQATEEEAQLQKTIKEKTNNAPRYIDTADRAENYKSGAFVLISVGIAGVIVLILMNLGIITLPVPQTTKTMINVVMGILFICFIALGVNSYTTYKKVQALANEEDDYESKIDEWADNELDIEAVKANDSSSESEEIMYFNRTEAIRVQLEEHFPDMDESFKEHVIEDLYDRIFGCE